MVKIAIIDYGVGNLHSIRRGIELAGATAEIIQDLEKMDSADGVVLPGVGAFNSAMERLSPNIRLIERAASSKQPILGICLGVQLFLSWSEEGGGGKGLDLIPGKVVKFTGGCKVPQMGWNSLKIVKEHPILDGIKSGDYAYFVHSYFTNPDDKKTVLATTDYCIEFPSVIAKDSLVGMQFHPEKSGLVGLRMLKNFVRIVKR